jgi:hypothetical protein
VPRPAELEEPPNSGNACAKDGPPPGSDKAAAATALLAYVVFAFVVRILERPKT